MQSDKVQYKIRVQAGRWVVYRSIKSKIFDTKVTVSDAIADFAEPTMADDYVDFLTMDLGV